MIAYVPPGLARQRAKAAAKRPSAKPPKRPKHKRDDLTLSDDTRAAATALATAALADEPEVVCSVCGERVAASVATVWPRVQVTSTAVLADLHWTCGASCAVELERRAAAVVGKSSSEGTGSNMLGAYTLAAV